MNRLKQVSFWAVCSTVAVLSLLPADYLPSAFNWWDKAKHVLAFLAVGALFGFGFLETSWIWVAPIPLAGSLCINHRDLDS